jgi:hypothetical protein
MPLRLREINPVLPNGRMFFSRLGNRDKQNLQKIRPENTFARIYFNESLLFNRTNRFSFNQS